MKYLRKLKIELVRGEYKNPIKGQVREAKQIYEVFKAIKDKNQETLIGVYMNNDLEVSAYDTLSVGSMTETGVSSDEVFNRAIITRSRYIVLIHNHPSGNPREIPSLRLRTRRLCEPCAKERSGLKRYFSTSSSWETAATGACSRRQREERTSWVP